MVLPAIDYIDQELTTNALDSTKYSLPIRTGLAMGRKTLNCYYSKMDYSNVYRIAMSKYLNFFSISDS